MPFVADDLLEWLVSLLAEAGRRKLATFVLGDRQGRTLRRAFRAAPTATVADWCPLHGAAR
jgi:hypothetical protein